MVKITFIPYLISCLVTVVNVLFWEDKKEIVSLLKKKKKKYDLTSHRWLRINKQRSSGQKIVVTK